MFAIGIDIGGTKCAVTLGQISDEKIDIIYKCEPLKSALYTPEAMLNAIAKDIIFCKAKLPLGEKIIGAGISCGGPLNSKQGVILSPPNLPNWDKIEICKIVKEKTGLNSWLCNDANACALAEWKFGAGKGCSSMLFLTFGTGLGAGIILDQNLYVGASDMAGELGHIRLENFGPVGYGKAGSFEGFCSGGGIAQIAKSIFLEQLQMGNKPPLCCSIEKLETLDAKTISIAAKNGDPLAIQVLQIVGTKLGVGLSIIIDLLNPQKIVIGSVFARAYNEIWPFAKKVIEKETLPGCSNVCEVLPAKLGDSLGDIAALCVALYYGKKATTIQQFNGLDPKQTNQA